MRFREITHQPWQGPKDLFDGLHTGFQHRFLQLRHNGIQLLSDWPKCLSINCLGPGKLEHIHARTGRTALFAGGNGDVDLEMLQEARFRLVVVHDDGEREYVVTAAAEKLLAAGEAGGWTMVSMKDDWKTIYKEGVVG